ncbi:MAG: LPXTG cell wall anchor domain-containing protein [Streptococcaceae bacterium]|jgi:LPXTG-motif cell wall-anchored protein|nr:LPXTG cell wall anchor domain-containing protein [Streptococcaceae bacterium]
MRTNTVKKMTTLALLGILLTPNILAEAKVISETNVKVGDRTYTHVVADSAEDVPLYVLANPTAFSYVEKVILGQTQYTDDLDFAKTQDNFKQEASTYAYQLGDTVYNVSKASDIPDNAQNVTEHSISCPGISAVETMTYDQAEALEKGSKTNSYRAVKHENVDWKDVPEALKNINKVTKTLVKDGGKVTTNNQAEAIGKAEYQDLSVDYADMSKAEAESLLASLSEQGYLARIINGDVTYTPETVTSEVYPTATVDKAALIAQYGTYEDSWKNGGTHNSYVTFEAQTSDQETLPTVVFKDQAQATAYVNQKQSEGYTMTVAQQAGDWVIGNTKHFGLAPTNTATQRYSQGQRVSLNNVASVLGITTLGDYANKTYTSTTLRDLAKKDLKNVLTSRLGISDTLITFNEGEKAPLVNDTKLAGLVASPNQYQTNHEEAIANQSFKNADQAAAYLNQKLAQLAAEGYVDGTYTVSQVNGEWVLNADAPIIPGKSSSEHAVNTTETIPVSATVLTSEAAANDAISEILAAQAALGFTGNSVRTSKVELPAVLTDDTKRNGLSDSPYAENHSSVLATAGHLTRSQADAKQSEFEATYGTTPHVIKETADGTTAHRDAATHLTVAERDAWINNRLAQYNNDRSNFTISDPTIVKGDKISGISTDPAAENHTAVVDSIARGTGPEVEAKIAEWEAKYSGEINSSLVSVDEEWADEELPEVVAWTHDSTGNTEMSHYSYDMIRALCGMTHYDATIGEYYTTVGDYLKLASGLPYSEAAAYHNQLQTLRNSGVIQDNSRVYIKHLGATGWQKYIKTISPVEYYTASIKESYHYLPTSYYDVNAAYDEPLYQVQAQENYHYLKTPQWQVAAERDFYRLKEQVVTVDLKAAYHTENTPQYTLDFYLDWYTTDQRETLYDVAGFKEIEKVKVEIGQRTPIQLYNVRGEKYVYQPYKEVYSYTEYFYRPLIEEATTWYTYQLEEWVESKHYSYRIDSLNYEWDYQSGPTPGPTPPPTPTPHVPDIPTPHVPVTPELPKTGTQPALPKTGEAQSAVMAFGVSIVALALAAFGKKRLK